MKIATSRIDPIAEKKRALIDELYVFMHEQNNEDEAFFDVKINPDNPHESRIIANRPGLELFATELMIASEGYHEDIDDVRYEIEQLEAKKWVRKGASVGFSELEIIQFERYENDIWHNDNVNTNKSIIGIVTFIITFTVCVLAMFGLVSVIRFFME